MPTKVIPGRYTDEAVIIKTLFGFFPRSRPGRVSAEVSFLSYLPTYLPIYLRASFPR